MNDQNMNLAQGSCLIELQLVISHFIVFSLLDLSGNNHVQIPVGACAFDENVKNNVAASVATARLKTFLKMIFESYFMKLKLRKPR